MSFINAKRLLVIFVMVILIAQALILPGCAPQQAPAPPSPIDTPPPADTEGLPALRVRFHGNYPPPPASMSRGFEFFQKRVAELSGGTITFENFWGAALLTPAEALDGTQRGVADLAVGLPVITRDRTPLGGLSFIFPFRPTDPGVMLEIKREMYDTIPAFSEELEQYNIKLLALQPSPNFGLLTTMPINTLDDLEGKKLALAGADFPIFEAIGAVPVSMPGAERYEGLQHGVIDGQSLDIIPMADEAHYEVAKYFTYTNMGAICTIHLWANLDFWNALTPRQQEIFEQAAAEMMDWWVINVKEKEAEAKRKMEEANVTFTELPDAEKKKWAEAIPDLPATWADDMEKRGLPGWEIVDTFKRLADEAGHVWLRDWGKR